MILLPFSKVNTYIYLSVQICFLWIFVIDFSLNEWTNYLLLKCFSIDQCITRSSCSCYLLNTWMMQELECNKTYILVYNIACNLQPLTWLRRTKIMKRKTGWRLFDLWFCCRTWCTEHLQIITRVHFQNQWNEDKCNSKQTIANKFIHVFELKVKLLCMRDNYRCRPSTSTHSYTGAIGEFNYINAKS